MRSVGEGAGPGPAALVAGTEPVSAGEDALFGLGGGRRQRDGARWFWRRAWPVIRVVIGVAVVATVNDQFGNPVTINAQGTLTSNNITNNGNPNAVNNVLGSPQFLTYARGQARAFNVRLKLLGRK